MADAPPPQTGRERLISLIAGISTWKQALILIVVGFAILGGVMLYQHPEWVEEVFHRESTELTMVPAEQIQGELPTVRREIEAEVVFVLGTVVARNQAWLIAYDAAPDVADTLKELAGTRATTNLPIFAESYTWNMALVAVLDGEVSCIPLGEVEAEVVKRTGIVEVCVSGIPPGPRGLIGLLVAGFREPRDRPARTHVRNALRSAALNWMQ
jgi:hypothetical protein